MNKLLKDLIKSLKKEPASSLEEIQKVMMLFKDFYLEKKYYTIVDVYMNYTCTTPHLLLYRDLPYYVWYNMKYKDKRYICIDGKLLNYNLAEYEKNELNNVIDYLIHKKNIKFKQE